MSEDPGCKMKVASTLDALLQAREEAFRAMELGENEIEYRGWWIDIEEFDREGVIWGWEYVFNGNRRGEPLEEIFEEIDKLSGSTEDEIRELAEAWEAHLEVRH
jgi:hypothetical protein